MMGEFDNFDWKEEDREFMDKIQKECEDLEIPETLSPENMMRRIEEDKNSQKGRRKWMKILTTAAAIGIITLAAWQINANILKVEDNTTQVKNHITQIKDYSEICSRLKNIEEINDIQYEDAVMEENIGSVIEDSAVEKSEVSKTNVQVEGIDEADVVKNDDKYIYALDVAEKKVDIISMEEKKKLSEIKLVNSYIYYQSQVDMYVWNDTLVVMGSYIGNETEIKLYDISDRENPVEINEIQQQGYYHTSRLTENYLYVMSNCRINGPISEDNCVPRIEDRQIEPDCVLISENPTSKEYEFIISIDLNHPEDVLDKKAINMNSSYGYTYMSDHNIYVTDYNYFYAGEEKATTQIFKIGYEDGKFADATEGKVKGRVYGQFAMDEYKGYLRVVTTVDAYTNESTQDENMVYVLDSSLNAVGTIGGIAPGERIYSARFMGDTGYFVTYYQTDPLFEVDFSEPENPVIKGQLEITGFSDYLHSWSENELLGMGYVDGKLKLSMFELQGDGNMREITRKVFGNYEYSPATDNHKALMVDAESNLIGFSARSYSDGMLEGFMYEVYSYQDGKFVSRLSVEIDRGKMEDSFSENYYHTRAVYDKDTLYLVVPGYFIKLYDKNTMEAKGEIKLG